MRQFALLLAEIPHQHLHGQAALHLELGVEPIARAGELVARDVGADDLDLAARQASPGTPRGSSPANRLPAPRRRPPTRCAAACRAAGRRAGAAAPACGRAANGLSSRKKKLSLVVIASTTSRASAVVARTCAAGPPAGSRSRKPVALQDRREPGLQQIQLVRADHQPGSRFQQRRRASRMPARAGRHARAARSSSSSLRRDLRQRQHRVAQPGLGDGARHAPDHAGRLVLGDGAAAGRDDPPRALQPVAAHAGQHRHQHAARRRRRRRCAASDRPTGGRNSPAGPWSAAPAARAGCPPPADGGRRARA